MEPCGSFQHGARHIKPGQIFRQLVEKVTNSTKAGISKAVYIQLSCDTGISWAPPSPKNMLGLLNTLKHNVQVLESYGYFFLLVNPTDNRL